MAISRRTLFRQMAATAMGLMKAKTAEGTLRQHFEPAVPAIDPVGNACRWAVGRVTGKPFPPFAPVRQVEQGYFLMPNR